MRLMIAFTTIAAALALSIFAARASADGLNKSASTGLYWSTAKEEGDLVAKADAAGDSSLLWDDDDENHRDFDAGGFSSLDGMLQWAIGHSDPSKLKEAAKDVQHLSPDELKKRHMEIKELMEKLKMPSDAQLMRIAIDDLKNSSLPSEDRLRALEELSILVEPIDNANELHKLGGLIIVIKQLNHPEQEVRTASALILGKACQNNPVVQKQVLELDALAKLIKMARSEFVEEAIKALLAISALIRNNFVGQELFYAEAGELMIQDILSNSSIDIRIQKKSVLLVADLAECQLENGSNPEPHFFHNRFFLRSVVDLLASVDLDLQEKALYAVKNLLQLRTEALVFKEFCGLDAALEKMRQQLQQLVMEENYSEYAKDVETLRGEVERVFIGKLNKDTQFPT
ncbi:unnamed protein product [Coffea canephora]|uniref:Nucleotide exchange factor Fes1 domain-containing protein n=1 Tax=Coffea canephora TaxID=49390 RepID=A0A068VEI0_COFCA|nr:unnamed protein product [Coffea canephora]